MNKQYHHGDLATSIVEAAIPLLDQHGPHQLSLRKLARMAGVSHGAPAHHFGGKTGLLTQVAIEGHQGLVKALEAACAETLNEEPADLEVAHANLVEAGKAYVRFAVANKGYFSVMFQTDLIDANNEAYRCARYASKRVLEDCVLALSRDKKITPKDVEATLTALWSQVHGFSVLWLAGNFGDHTDSETFEKHLDRMLASIEPRVG